MTYKLLNITANCADELEVTSQHIVSEEELGHFKRALFSKSLAEETFYIGTNQESAFDEVVFKEHDISNSDASTMASLIVNSHNLYRKVTRGYPTLAELQKLHPEYILKEGCAEEFLDELDAKSAWSETLNDTKQYEKELERLEGEYKTYYFLEDGGLVSC